MSDSIAYSQYSESESEPSEQLEPAWFDSDDENLDVDVADVKKRRKLRHSHEETTISTAEYIQRMRAVASGVGAATWAEPALTAAIARRADGLAPAHATVAVGTDAATAVLPSDRLRIASAGTADFGDAAVTCLTWHPNARTVAVGQYSSRVHLYSVPDSEKLATMVFSDSYPPAWIAASPDGERFYVTGRRPHYFVIDLAAQPVRPVRVEGVTTPTPAGPLLQRNHETAALSPCGAWLAVAGSEGAIFIISTETMQRTATFRGPASVKALAWGGLDGSTLLAVGEAGAILAWDVGTAQLRAAGADLGAKTLTSVSACVGTDLFAVGAEDGVLSLYSLDALPAPSLPLAAATPTKTFDHLVLPITSIAWHPTGQMVAWASARGRDALRVAHIGAGTVFSNWPTSTTPLNRVSAMAFSPDGTSLAVGNGRGRVLFYRLLHFAKHN